MEMLLVGGGLVAAAFIAAAIAVWFATAAERSRSRTSAIVLASQTEAVERIEVSVDGLATTLSRIERAQAAILESQRETAGHLRSVTATLDRMAGMEELLGKATLAALRIGRGEGDVAEEPSAVSQPLAVARPAS